MHTNKHQNQWQLFHFIFTLRRLSHCSRFLYQRPDRLMGLIYTEDSSQCTPITEETQLSFFLSHVPGRCLTHRVTEEGRPTNTISRPTPLSYVIVGR